MKALWNTYKSTYSGISAPIWWLSGVLLIHRAGTMVMPFMAIYLAKERSIEKEYIGIILSAYGVGAIAGIFVSGKLTDRWGASRVMQFSLFSSGICFWALWFVSGFIPLTIALFVLAFFAELFRPASNVAIIASSSEEERMRAFALQRLAINAGLSLGPAIGGHLAQWHYAALFVVDGMSCWLAGLFLWMLVPAESFQNPSPKRDARESEVVDRNEVASSSITSEARPSAKSDSPWHDYQFLTTMSLFMIGIFVFFNVFSTFPLFLKEEYLFEEGYIGNILAINMILIVIVEMPLLKFLERYANLKVVAVGLCFMGFGFGVLPLGPGSLFLAVASVLLWTIGEMLMFPIGAAYASKRAKAGQAGAYMAVLSLAFSLAHVVGVPLNFAIYEHWGSNVLWFSALIVCLVAAVPVYFRGRRERT